MNEAFKFLKNIIQHQTVQILVVLGGLAVTLINFFIASKLSPLASNMAVIATQVQATTTRLDADEKFIPQFTSLQQTVTGQKDQLDRIEGRVDSIDNFLRGYK